MTGGAAPVPRAQAVQSWTSGAKDLVICKTCQASNAAQNLTLPAVAGVGVVLMVAARIFLKPAFFTVPRQSDPGPR